VSRFIPKTGLVLSLVGGFAAVTILACLLRKLIGPLVTARFDTPIIQYAAAHRVAGLTSVMKALTTAGNPLYLSITVLVGGAILGWLTRSWRPLLVLALVMLGAVSLDHLIKRAVARTRPALLYWAVSATGSSFPSGHASESAAVYLTLARMFAGTETRLGVRTLTYAIGIAAPLLIGMSRVYLGVHWPTDVAIGWALGAMWSAIVLASSSAVRSTVETC
jgi:undecaprenyl-diphosphatase